MMIKHLGLGRHIGCCIGIGWTPRGERSKLGSRSVHPKKKDTGTVHLATINEIICFNFVLVQQ